MSVYWYDVEKLNHMGKSLIVATAYGGNPTDVKDFDSFNGRLYKSFIIDDGNEFTNINISPNHEYTLQEIVELFDKTEDENISFNDKCKFILSGNSNFPDDI